MSAALGDLLETLDRPAIVITTATDSTISTDPYHAITHHDHHRLSNILFNTSSPIRLLPTAFWLSDGFHFESQSTPDSYPTTCTENRSILQKRATHSISLITAAINSQNYTGIISILDAIIYHFRAIDPSILFDLIECGAYHFYNRLVQNDPVLSSTVINLTGSGHITTDCDALTSSPELDEFFHDNNRNYPLSAAHNQHYSPKHALTHQDLIVWLINRCTSGSNVDTITNNLINALIPNFSSYIIQTIPPMISISSSSKDSSPNTKSLTSFNNSFDNDRNNISHSLPHPRFMQNRSLALGISRIVFQITDLLNIDSNKCLRYNIIPMNNEYLLSENVIPRLSNPLADWLWDILSKPFPLIAVLPQNQQLSEFLSSCLHDNLEILYAVLFHADILYMAKFILLLQKFNPTFFYDIQQFSCDISWSYQLDREEFSRNKSSVRQKMYLSLLWGIFTFTLRFLPPVQNYISHRTNINIVGNHTTTTASYTHQPTFLTERYIKSLSLQCENEFDLVQMITPPFGSSHTEDISGYDIHWLLYIVQLMFLPSMTNYSSNNLSILPPYYTDESHVLSKCVQLSPPILPLSLQSSFLDHVISPYIVSERVGVVSDFLKDVIIGEVDIRKVPIFNVITHKTAANMIVFLFNTFIMTPFIRLQYPIPQNVLDTFYRDYFGVFYAFFNGICDNKEVLKSLDLQFVENSHFYNYFKNNITFGVHTAMKCAFFEGATLLDQYDELIPVLRWVIVSAAISWQFCTCSIACQNRIDSSISRAKNNPPPNSHMNLDYSKIPMQFYSHISSKKLSSPFDHTVSPKLICDISASSTINE